MSSVEEIFHICICDTSMIHTNVAVLMYLFGLFWEDGMSESIVDLDTPKIHEKLKFWCSKPKL